MENDNQQSETIENKAEVLSTEVKGNSLQNKDAESQEIEILDDKEWPILKAAMFKEHNFASDERLERIHTAACVGANLTEICAYAGISRQGLYNFFKNFPKLRKFIEQWQQQPVFKAKQTVVGNLNSVSNAQWYLEKKSPDFKPKQTISVENLTAEKNMFLEKLQKMDENERQQIINAFEKLNEQGLPANQAGDLPAELADNDKKGDLSVSPESGELETGEAAQ